MFISHTTGLRVGVANVTSIKGGQLLLFCGVLWCSG